ncbi:phosphogluconate dehydratase [Campylobacter sp. RM12651]|uniref:phosphogluconate dehydratase n=1 Tax=Campylobacter sp. RM12651 TaxID=1660079 RepID=UPI001EFB934D|nr:phosphogluconate dehydratase [Campylobacter sp. RM12651]ULO03562.1 phosphogluconate dehydratase [Campylobacter sp. RM12651]
MTNKKLLEITEKIIKRSEKTRKDYLNLIDNANEKINRSKLGCANLAHAYAAIPESVREKLNNSNSTHLAIISSYNDVLSAHEPYKDYPLKLKQSCIKEGVSVQVASCTPSMCDGITQGYDGMQLSLYSRDVIAMSTAIGLSHNIFDGAFYLGVCDKIVPGLLMGALRFGQLPAMFIPSGPMPTGLSNSDKSIAREKYAQGLISKQDLLNTEMKMYHSSGTCTFYGTANSNQVMIELLGLHMPNSAFINPNTKLREKIIDFSARHFAKGVKDKSILPIGKMIDEKSIVNAIVGLMATGGSTNHTLHLIAIAKAAGIIINWDDFNDISNITPLLAKVYPNGKADINDFYEAGGLSFVINELLNNGALHDDVNTIAGFGLSNYTKDPILKDDEITYEKCLENSRNVEIITTYDKPFSTTGGLKVLSGNIGRSVIKVSAVSDDNLYIKQRAIVFNDQLELMKAYEKGELNKDFIAVVKYQGPRANGMPELHKLIPPLGVLMSKGYKVALITDGRMSGASGKVPAAIHTSPEALLNGNISKIKDGDLIEFDAINGTLNVLEDDFLTREIKHIDLSANELGSGRELFKALRNSCLSAEEGGVSF